MLPLSGCVSGPRTGTPAATPAATPATAPATTSQTGTTTVEIKGYTFVPETVTVPVGTTVTWINRDNASHTITSISDKFDSGELNQGQTYNYTFNQKGTYEYSCKVHPTMSHGRVIAT